MSNNRESDSSVRMSEFANVVLADTNGSSTNDANEARICLVDKNGLIIDDGDSLMFDINANVCDANGVIVAAAANELIAGTNTATANRTRPTVDDQTTPATPYMPTSMDSEKQQAAVAHGQRLESVFECEF